MRGMSMEVTIRISWDDEASVWIAYGEGIGFALESESYDRLVERVKVALPDYLSENNNPEPCTSIRFLTEERRVHCA